MVFMCLARPVSSTQKNLNLCDISRAKLGMQLIFCMQRNIRVFNKLILSFVNGVASLPKIPKIRSLQYLTNDMLDYLDFRYVHRPTNHESNSLHKCQSRLLQMIIFILKKEFSVQGWIMMFSWSEILWSHTNIIPVIIFNKKRC